MPTIVKQCNCKSDFQDRTYGKNMRLHNEKLQGKGSVCTVCGSIKK